MPPSADPIRWQIVAAVVALLKTMDTTGYFYPPEEVASITPPIHEYLNDRSPQTETVYGVWVEDSDTTERVSGRKDKTMRVFVQAARRYVPSVSDPFKQFSADQDPEEEERSKLAHDFERILDKESRIGGGNQLDGLYENWELLGDDAFQVTSVRCPGWVMIQFETLFTYHHSLGEPTQQGAP